MKLHHLNCGCMCPVGGKLLPSVFPREVVCHCVLIETARSLILIDCGLARRDVSTSRLGFMKTLLGVVPSLERTAYEQVRLAGFSPSDVTDLVPTHLDFDHAGGIEDFPQARVHVSRAEHEACFTSGDIRYKTVRFSHDVKWQLYESQERWRDFDSAELPEGLRAIRLPGHTLGHHGILIGDLLHAGDAYYDHRELGAQSLGLRMFQYFAHHSPQIARATHEKLRALKDVRVFCAHDPAEMAAF